MPRTSLEPGIEGLFTRHVIAVDSDVPGDVAALHPEEALHVQGAVAKRAKEFAAGRACARRALDGLGIRDFTLLAAEDRRPQWPSAVVGSITHTDGYCAAAVAHRQSRLALGIDSEQVSRVGPNIRAKIALEIELTWVAGLPSQLQQPAVAMLFSAKEAFYKCQYPLTEQWLNFHDLQIESEDFALPNGYFKVHAQRELKIDAHVRWPVTGRYRFHDSLVSTAVEIANELT